jgi:hypothetical protein
MRDERAECLGDFGPYACAGDDHFDHGEGGVDMSAGPDVADRCPSCLQGARVGEALVPERVEVCGDDAAAEASQAPNEDLAEWDGLADGRPTTAAKIVTSAA